MAAQKYEIQRRRADVGKQRWAVIQTGPKGGKRFVAVYQDEVAAQHVADLLNASRHREA